jgi:hypothetical protein
MHRLLTVVVLSLVVTVSTISPLLAQVPPSDVPRLEVGVDAVVASPDAISERTRPLLSPRVRLNVSPRTALIVSGDLIAKRDYVGESWADQRVVTVELRRGLWQSERAAIGGLIGGGVGRSQFFQPEYRYLVRNEPVIVPASTYTTTGPEFVLGVGAEQRIAPRLALRQEVKVVLGEVSDFRAQVGVSVPIGRYAPRFQPLLSRSGGRPDSLRNGTGIGAIIGAGALASFVAFIGQLFCEGDCNNLGPAIAAGAGYGAGAGALLGAMTDSFIE